jgi:hypothetical protein
MKFKTLAAFDFVKSKSYLSAKKIVGRRLHAKSRMSQPV